MRDRGRIFSLPHFVLIAADHLCTWFKRVKCFEVRVSVFAGVGYPMYFGNMSFGPRSSEHSL
jgi:hypothetical protein